MLNETNAERSASGASVRVKANPVVPVKGDSTMRVGDFEPPLARSTPCTMPGCVAATAVVRKAPWSTKEKPDEEPTEESNFVVGTRDELSRLLSTTYWP